MDHLIQIFTHHSWANRRRPIGQILPKFMDWPMSVRVIFSTGNWKSSRRRTSWKLDCLTYFPDCNPDCTHLIWKHVHSNHFLSYRDTTRAPIAHETWHMPYIRCVASWIWRYRSDSNWSSWNVIQTVLTRSGSVSVQAAFWIWPALWWPGRFLILGVQYGWIWK